MLILQEACFRIHVLRVSVILHFFHRPVPPIEGFLRLYQANSSVRGGSNDAILSNLLALKDEFEACWLSPL